MTTMRVCLFDRTAAPEIRQALGQLSGVELDASATNWDELQQALSASPPDTVVLHLDGAEISSGFLMTQRVLELTPHVGVVGLCGDARPETIIAAMRAGCQQIARLPIDLQDLQSAIERTRRVNDTVRNAANHRCFCVMGASGGAGATTIACNLALELASISGERVAIVDMNLEFADVACHFDTQPKCGVADVCKPEVEIDQTLLQGAFTHLDSGVSVLSKPAFPSDIASIDPAQVETLFETLKEKYTYVVCDLPRSFSPLVLAALHHADRVLLVTQLAVPFLRNATRIYENLLHMGASEEHIELVLNRSNASYEMITSKEVAEHFGRPVFGEVPNDYKRLTNVRDLGASLAHEAPNSPARIGIHNLASKLCAGVTTARAENSNAKQQTTLLQRLWGRNKPKIRS
jgi:pilus assembly protein CpaE